MKKPVPISDDKKWQAVVSCDKSYDGLFLYGVKTTGIFCRPSWPPCIGADGSLTGYRGGLELKKGLLDMEKRKEHADF